jgi:pteridine reductase
MALMELTDRVALVTGAARRVGRAIAVRLAHCGCRVAVHYHRSRAAADEVVADCRAHGHDALSFSADLADARAPAQLVQAVLGHFGRLDILVNNASVFQRMTIDEFAPEAFEQTLRVNTLAPLALVHAAREALRAARGRVVNLCDISTQRPWPDHLAYMASKGALDTLTRALARALAPDVNVVGIAPGVAAWPDDYDAARRERLTARIPLRRAGTPEDVAAAVEFVLSAGDYITGAILPVDGGRHVV